MNMPKTGQPHSTRGDIQKVGHMKQLQNHPVAAAVVGTNDDAAEEAYGASHFLRGETGMVWGLKYTDPAKQAAAGSRWAGGDEVRSGEDLFPAKKLDCLRGADKQGETGEEEDLPKSGCAWVTSQRHGRQEHASGASDKSTRVEVHFQVPA